MGSYSETIQFILHFWKKISFYVYRLLCLCLRRCYFHFVPMEKALTL